MALEHSQPRLSYADYQAMPAETVGEIMEGELLVTLSPTPRHQSVVASLIRHLGNYMEAHPAVGTVYPASLDVVLRAESPAVVLQPDVLFVSQARAHIVGQQAIHGAPDLVVKVVSPSTGSMDAVRKRELYVITRCGASCQPRSSVLWSGPGGSSSWVSTTQPTSVRGSSPPSAPVSRMA